MAKNLLIVESPAKAKTIEKILGPDFTVKSSFGHVRDLEKGTKGVDVEQNFKPNYIVTPDKTKVVKGLRDAVKSVDEVWLATDEDREGEAISWHLCEVLGLDPKTTKRIVFREITKPAIQSAIQQPRTVDLNLVDAQQARRILDRLVGFELSGLLWRKVKSKLSAGRVQSVTMKIVVEREREIMEFTAKPFFRVNALFTVLDKDGKATDLKAEMGSRNDKFEEAEDVIKKCVGPKYEIKKIDLKPLKRKPTAPFTTSTLQQEASRKLGFSVNRTMSNAQKLYEQGFITYMRTDSLNLSETALTAIATEIEKNYGKNYLHTRRYKSKKKDAQEAHEAIRPTYIDRQTVTNDYDQQRLYELIWKRTIASQMAEAELEKTIVQIGISTIPNKTLKAEGQILKFDGFLKVYLESKDEDEEDQGNSITGGILPPLSVGQPLQLQVMTATERFTRPPARYTEAALVKKMEELGIGRPSTYAPTISKIMDPSRGYVTKEPRDGVERKYRVLTLANNQVAQTEETENTGAIKNRLIATDLGMLVSDFLSTHFNNIMTYGFTAEIEKDFDVIADGGKQWGAMLKDFYTPFHAKVIDAMENAERATGERILGTDPASGRTLLVRMTKFGTPVAQIGAQNELNEDEKPRYANLRPGQSMETIQMEDCLELFKLPKTLGTYKDAEVIVAVGRFGPYVKFGDTFISIPKGHDPLEVKMDFAQELIDAKLEADKPIAYYKEKPITKGAGRFGPFVKWDEFFVNIPKRFDPAILTAEEAIELVKIKEEKEANRYIHRWEDLKLSVENGRWGPLVRFGKKKFNLPKKEDGSRVTPEEAAEFTLEQVKEMVEETIPGAFAVKPKKKRKTKAKPKAKKK